MRLARSEELDEFLRQLVESETLPVLWLQILEDLLHVTASSSDDRLTYLTGLLAASTNVGDLCVQLEPVSLALAHARLLAQSTGRESKKSEKKQIDPAKSVDYFSKLQTEIVTLNWQKQMPELFTELSLKTGDRALTPFVILNESNQRYVFLNRHFGARMRLLLSLAGLVQKKADPTQKNATEINAAIKEITRSKPLTLGGKAISLTSDQERALEVSLKNQFAIITGGPGTGKTLLIISLVRALIRLDFDVTQIAIVAPTGRAARRITESMEQVKLQDSPDSRIQEIAATTIHRLLGYSRRDSAPRALGERVLIVDEVSMVDLELMSDLMSAVDPARTRVILLGDRNQLPSVEAGAVLGDLIRAALPMPNNVENTRVVELVGSHRSASEILSVANSMIQGKIQIPDGESPNQTAEQGCYFQKLDGIPGLIETWLDGNFGELPGLLAIARSHVFEKENSELVTVLRQILEVSRRGKILTVLRGGPRGAVTWNRMVTQVARRKWKQHGDVCAGVPWIITANDYSRDLYNGEIGVVVRFKDSVRCVFDIGGSLRAFLLESLVDAQPAFAITVHKSQGSEYDRVLLVLPDRADHPLLSKQIIYTGITRAKNQAIIIGERDVLDASVLRSAERTTGPIQDFSEILSA